MANRSVIITGAGTGIGAACARRFFNGGDHLILVDNDENAGKAMAESLQAEQQRVTFVHTDITSRLNVHNVIAEALETNGHIDVLIHADVCHHSAPFLEVSEDDFRDIIQHNLVGAFLINQAVARQMIRQIEEADTPQPAAEPNQAIVNLGSVEGVATHRDHTAFAASQGGLHQLSKAIALSLSDYQLRVNTIGVGPIRGENKISDPSQSVAPLKRLGEPEDVAEVAWFLTMPEASFVTGQTIFVDGGQLIQMRMPSSDAKPD